MAAKSTLYGLQAAVALQLGLSRQFVSLVAQGRKQHAGVKALLETLKAQQARLLRVQQFRHYINTLSDEQLAEFLFPPC